MAQSEPRTKASAGNAVANDDPWRRFVLSYGADSYAGESGDAPAYRQTAALNRAFEYHVKRMNLKPTLDADLVSHCNLNCACCCHFSPIAEPSFLALDDYERDLALLARIEDVEEFFDAICLMGGEPLLHPDLAEFVRLTRRYLPATEIRLVTNGLLLESQPPALWDALRRADASVLATPYPTGIDYARLIEHVRAQGVEAILGGGLAVSEDGLAYFLKTPLDVAGSQDPIEAFVSCPLAGTKMQLLDGRIFPCNRGALFTMLNRRFGTEFHHEADDYLELSAIRSAREIDDFRRTHKPMCRYCANGLTERIAWERSTCSPDEWIK